MTNAAGFAGSGRGCKDGRPGASVLAAAGLAISMATKDSLANFASGIMIILFRPFNVGDFIEAAGTKGIVEEIHVFNTILNSPDNVKTYVPNGAILAGNITNYSRERFRRIDLEDLPLPFRPASIHNGALSKRTSCSSLYESRPVS